jgi:1,4-dihydroxy-2-naphthoate octaprenyltransferase
MQEEPNERLLHTPVRCYWRATRPAFLAASVVPAVVGAAAAWAQGYALHSVLLAWTLLAVMLVHAGMNVLNDYYDEQNGTDRRNTQRLFPFTGGSRFIQNGVLSAGETLVFGAWLLTAAMLIGVGLAWQSGIVLLWVGAAGLLIGWGYSAPPLSLNGRGWGEPTIALSFGVLTPLGAWFVQTGALAWYPVLISLPLSLLIMNILLINQFPDSEADAASGKRHWVVRFGADAAAKVYVAAVLLATLLLVSWVMLDVLPPMALLSALPLGIALRAGLQLLEHAHTPHKLEPAIKMTIGSAVLHGLLLSLALWLV